MFVYLEEDCYGHKVFIVTKPTKSTCYLNDFYHFSRRSKIKQTRFSDFYRFFSCQYLVYFGNKLLNYMFS